MREGKLRKVQWGLNGYEIFFGIAQRKCLRGGNFTSVADLESQLRQFIIYYNTTMAHPFNWTYTGKPLEKTPWRSAVGALVWRSSGLVNWFRQCSLGQDMIPTPSVEFPIASCGFHRGQGQHALG